MYNLRLVGQQGLSEEAACKQRPLRGKEEKQGSKGTSEGKASQIQGTGHARMTTRFQERASGALWFIEKKNKECVAVVVFPCEFTSTYVEHFRDDYMQNPHELQREVIFYDGVCLFPGFCVQVLGEAVPEGPRVSLNFAAECADQ